MPIFVFGFDLSTDEKLGKSKHNFTSIAKYAEEFLHRNSPEEFFILKSKNSLEIFAVTENRDKLVSHFMRTLQIYLKVPSEKLKKRN